MTKVGLDSLRVYQLAEEGSIQTFHLTKVFPQGEWLRGRSVDQLRRSSESVANNIAETYSRHSKKDKLRILRDIVRGEAEETKRGITRAMKKEFCSENNGQPVIDLYTELLKTLHGYIKYVDERYQT